MTGEATGAPRMRLPVTRMAGSPSPGRALLLLNFVGFNDQPVSELTGMKARTRQKGNKRGLRCKISSSAGAR
jgi:hypothetical protein